MLDAHAQMVRTSQAGGFSTPEGGGHLAEDLVTALIAQLWALARECATENWDGDGAASVNPAAVIRAERFLRLLPDEVPVPEISPDPDGDISLDWKIGDFQLTMSIGASDSVPYAWLCDAESGHAVALFIGEILPVPIMEQLFAHTELAFCGENMHGVA